MTPAAHSAARASAELPALRTPNPGSVLTSRIAGPDLNAGRRVGSGVGVGKGSSVALAASVDVEVGFVLADAGATTAGTGEGESLWSTAGVSDPGENCPSAQREPTTTAAMSTRTTAAAASVHITTRSRRARRRAS